MRPSRDRASWITTSLEGATAGAVGASAIALWFLISDTVTREALWSPSLLGAVLFRGADPAAPVEISLGLVAGFSLVHGLTFMVFGALAAEAIRVLGLGSERVLTALLMYAGLEGGFLVLTSLVDAGLAPALGHGTVALANLFAASCMAGFLILFQDSDEETPRNQGKRALVPARWK